MSDAGLAHFKDCKDLTHLLVWTTQVSDAGLANFKGMPLRRCCGLTIPASPT